jgi:hypothetical protein
LITGSKIHENSLVCILPGVAPLDVLENGEGGKEEEVRSYQVRVGKDLWMKVREWSRRKKKC